MSSILIPANTPNSLPPDPEQQPPAWAGGDLLEAGLAPHLLLQLQDDLERARLREAFWMSVVFHLLFVTLLIFAPKIFPGMNEVVLATPADLMNNQKLTYLDLPPDMQKAVKAARDAKILSDKNRTAESRHPTIDKTTLEELRRAGAPGLSASPSQSAQNMPPPPQGTQQPNQSQNQQTSQLEPVPNPKLPVPAQGNNQSPVNFADMMKSPGSLTAQAASAVAAHRGTGSYGGGGGDYGIGPGRTAARVQGNLEVLSDTEGVDFGPYLSRVLQAVRMNWYNLIPEEARAPLMKKGKVSIEFVILKDGKIAGIKLTGPSGDVSLDRAAWGGITASVPFAPLPGEFRGPYLALRFHFYYNPAKGDMD